MNIGHAISKLLRRRSENVGEAMPARRPKPQPARSKRYSKEELARTGLLLRATAVSIGEAPIKGIFVGVYSGSEFESLDEFARFTTNISSITQDWYSYGDLDKAYEYYFPPEGGEDHPSWKSSAERFDGSLVEILEGLGYHYRGHPHLQDLAGTLWWGGDKSDFWVIGQGNGFYFEAYLADLT